MPTLGGRKQYSRVWRPSGTRFASAKTRTIPDAVLDAFVAFRAEFGPRPVQERTVIEIVGVTGAWDATVFELPEEER